MNFLTIGGHLGADPEVRFTQTGKKVTTLRVATRVRKGNADDTIWWRVTIWGEQYDKMIPYLKKGSAVVVVGELQKPEIFTDRDGKPQISLNVTAHTIQFSPFGRPDRSSQEGAGTSQAAQGAANPSPASSSDAGEVSYGMPGLQPGKASLNETMDDDVPF